MNEVPLQPVAECAAPVPGRATSYWLRNALRVAVFSAIVAALLGVFDPTLSGLVENLVYSECIGLCIYSVVTGMTRWAGHGDNAFWRYLVRGIVAIPIGLFAGLNLGAFLCGNPVGFAVLNHAAVFALPVTVVTSAAVMYFLWSRKRIADVAAANAEAQRQMAEARLRMLQAQIEPHMLFNTLANLRSLIDVDPHGARTMIDQLIVYLRGTLAASRGTSATLDHEFAQLRAYLELMKVRMATRLDFALELPDALRDCRVPPMLLQPLVENAIGHGLEPKIGGGSVRVVASSADGALTIDVEDSGIGLADDGSEAGYGLLHVRERLQTLHGDAGRFTIEPLPGGGVRARVVVPR